MNTISASPPANAAVAFLPSAHGKTLRCQLIEMTARPSTANVTAVGTAMMVSPPHPKAPKVGVK